MNKISVIVPIYKAENTLNRCVESIVNQTYKNLEIILVDDGSPDNCPQMCDEWGTRDQRISVIHKELDHVCEARNAGLRVATGDYCIWIDSDDYVELDMLERMLLRIEQTNADVAVCNVMCHWPDGRVEKRPLLNFDVISGDEAVYGIYTNAEGGHALWNKLIKKSLIDSIHPTFKRVSGQYSEDALFMTTIYSNAKIVCSVENHFYHYIISNNSTTRGGVLTEEKLQNWIASVDIFLDEFASLKNSDHTKRTMYKALKKYSYFLKYTAYQRSYFDSYRRILKVLCRDDISKIEMEKSYRFLNKMMDRNANKLFLRIVHKMLLTINWI